MASERLEQFSSRWSLHISMLVIALRREREKFRDEIK